MCYSVELLTISATKAILLKLANVFYFIALACIWVSLVRRGFVFDWSVRQVKYQLLNSVDLLQVLSSRSRSRFVAHSISTGFPSFYALFDYEHYSLTFFSGPYHVKPKSQVSWK